MGRRQNACRAKAEKIKVLRWKWVIMKRKDEPRGFMKTQVRKQVRMQCGVVRSHLWFSEALAFCDGEQLKRPLFLQRSVEPKAWVLGRYWKGEQRWKWHFLCTSSFGSYLESQAWKAMKSGIWQELSVIPTKSAGNLLPLELDGWEPEFWIPSSSFQMLVLPLSNCVAQGLSSLAVLYLSFLIYETGLVYLRISMKNKRKFSTVAGT